MEIIGFERVKKLYDKFYEEKSSHRGDKCDGCCIPDSEGLKEAMKQDATIPFNVEEK